MNNKKEIIDLVETLVNKTSRESYLTWDGVKSKTRGLYRGDMTKCREN